MSVSPSRLGLAKLCPGSVQLLREHDVKDQEGLERFRVMHAETARRDAERLSGEEGPPAAGLSSWEESLVSRAVTWYGDHPEPAYTFWEMRLGPLNLFEGTVRPELNPWGTPDRIMILEGETELAIDDLKFGPLPLDEKFCAAQGSGYAALAFNWYKKAARIRVRFYHVPENDTYEAEFARGDFPNICDAWRQIILDAEEPFPMWRPTYEGCRRCAPEKCSFAKAAMVAAAPKLQTKMLERTPEERGQLVAVAKLAAEAADAVERDAKELLEKDPAAVSGWAIQKQKPREIKNTRLAHLIATRSITDDAFLGACKVGIGGLETAYRELGLTGKALADRINSEFKSCITYGERVRLVPVHQRKLLEEKDADQP